MPGALNRLRPAVAMVALLMLVGCGAIKLTPEAHLPRALVQPLNAHVGLILDEELRHFRHEETRASSNWQVELGPGHEQWLKSVFSASFSNVSVFRTLDEARAASGLQGLFRPQIEQYSFATARETSGSYWAVTIRYRIAVFTPQGEPADSLSLTGYGSAPGSGRAGPSLAAATQAAIRDAAAKILVQMPRQPVASKLAAGETLRAGEGIALVDPIETVPIEPAATEAGHAPG